ncbi:MAG TPA: LPS export ABC transporter permease LptG [Methylophilus sp.]|nr:LPS export ABC transporter permease LptG [Methylophilus sp.]HQQ32748.1 LPS export ABC transporter permease LptG [Methylophilus sp.]
MNILSRYFWQEATVNIIMIMLGLLAMFSFFDLIQELDSLGRGNYGISKMLVFVLLSVPGHIYDVVPVAVLVGMMMSLGTFGRNSELVVMRVSGMSVLHIGHALVKIGLLFTLMTFLVGELITPISEKMAQRLRIKATESVIAQDFESGLWVKDSKSFVNIENVLPDASLMGIHIYEFDENFRLRSISNAKQGLYVDEKWGLTEVTQTQFNYAKRIEENSVKTQFFNKATWKSLIRPELLNVLLVAPEKMSAWNLYSFINHLKTNKQKSTRYEVALWIKMIYPIACVVMVILAMPFGFLQQRAGGTSFKIFIGILLGIVYQIMNRIFIHIGVLNDWPPLMSAIIPTLLFLITGLIMLLVIERR